MQTDSNFFSFADVAGEVFDLAKLSAQDMADCILSYLVGIMVWRSDLNSGRQVEDDTVLPSTSFAPCRFHSFAHLNSKLRFGLCKCLGAIFEPKSCAILGRALVGELPDNLSVLDRERESLLFCMSEYDITEDGRCRVVEMNDGELGASDRVNCSCNEVSACRRENLQ